MENTHHVKTVADLVRLSPDPMVIVQDGGFKLASASFAELLGYAQEDLAGGLRLMDLVSKEDQEAVLRRYKDRMAGKQVPRTNQVSLVAKGGTVIPCESSATLISYEERPADLVIIRDIRERVKAEKALKESETLLRTAVESLPFDFFALDETGRYVMQNSACRTHWGDHVGKRAEDAAPDAETLAVWQENNRRAFAGETVRGEVCFDVRGRRMFFYNIVSPIFDDGRVRGILGVNLDITDRKNTEEALRESEERYRNVVEQQTELIARYRRDGTLTFVNEAVCRFFGMKPEDLVGRGVEEFLSGEEREKLASQRVTMSAENPLTYMEHRVLDRNGQGRWLQWVNRGIFDDRGLLTEIQAVGRDVTERRRAEEALTESEDKFRSLAEQSPNMIFISSEGHVLYANEQCVKTMRYSQEELYDPEFDFLRLIAPEYLVLTKDNLRRHARGEEVEPYEYEIMTRDGKRIPAVITTKLITYQGRKAILGIVTNVSQLKVTQHELEVANRYKDEFMATMSHNLRTPLASILGAAEILKAGRAQDQTEHFLDMIIRNGHHLLRLMNDIADLSQIEAGQMEISTTRCSVPALVQEAVVLAEGMARSLRVAVQVDSRDPIFVLADRTRVLQVLDNLLANALKFTPEGGMVSVSWRAIEDRCEIRVSDTGIGIPKDQHDRVFSRFERIITNPVHEGMRKGVGIGLSLVHSLVEMQGGKVFFESDAGMGASFSFTLPLSHWDCVESPVQRKSPPPCKGTSPRLAGVSILVIEDDLEMAEMLRMYLTPEGVDMTLAVTSQEGLRGAREDRPDIILLDIRLPDMDGYLTASLLACDPETRRIPIIALTAHAMSTDREECLRVGCADYFSKPVDFDRLIAAVSKALGKKEQA